MNSLGAIAFAVVLLLLNAFFVGAEFALVSARRPQIEPRAVAGSRPAKITLRAMERVSLMMAGAQLGITVCSLLLGAVGEPAVAGALEPLFVAVGLSGAVTHLISFVIAMIVVVYLHMVIGEMVPKNLALAHPEKAAIALGPPLYALVLILKPLLWLMNAIANLVLQIIRVTPADEVASTFTADEIQSYVHQSGELGMLDERDHDLMLGAVTFSKRTAREVLVPLNELVVLPHDADVQFAEQECVRTGFSRFPVADDQGELMGYVHLKDLLSVMLRRDGGPRVGDRVRPLAQVAADAPLDEVLATMQQHGSHIAIVRDDHATAGAVSPAVVGAAMLEDVVEMMVGDVTEETAG